MFLFGNLIHAVAALLSYALTIYIWVIIIRALISWVNPDPFNPIVRFLRRLTGRGLEPVRRRLPDFGGIDVSPIVVLLVIFFLQNFLVASLMDMARLLR